MYLLAMRRSRQRVNGTLIRILDGRFGRVQRAIEGVQRGQREMRLGQRDQMRTRRDRQLWGSCCTMQFGVGMMIAGLSAICSPERYMKLTVGRLESFSSISFLQALNSLIHTHNLPPSLMGSSLPFNHSLSPVSNDSSAREVVVDLKWSWSSVTERDELVGRMSLVSRLPQYLWVS